MVRERVLDDPENHSPARLRGTDQTLRRGTGLGPGLTRLSSSSALVRLELRASCLGAGSVHARWDLVVRERILVDPENHSPVRHRPNTEMRARPRPGPAPAQLRLGSGSARAQSEPLRRGLGPCKVGLSDESATLRIPRIILRCVFVAQTKH